MRNKPMCRRIKLRPVFDRPGKWKEDTAMPPHPPRLSHGGFFFLFFFLVKKKGGGVLQLPLQTAAYTRFSTV